MAPLHPALLPFRTAACAVAELTAVTVFVLAILVWTAPADIPSKDQSRLVSIDIHADAYRPLGGLQP
jgi:hypothetical protein